jgi:hypothetical protein
MPQSLTMIQMCAELKRHAPYTETQGGHYHHFGNVFGVFDETSSILKDMGNQDTKCKGVTDGWEALNLVFNISEKWQQHVKILGEDIVNWNDASRLGEASHKGPLQLAIWLLSTAKSLRDLKITFLINKKYIPTKSESFQTIDSYDDKTKSVHVTNIEILTLSATLDALSINSCSDQLNKVYEGLAIYYYTLDGPNTHFEKVGLDTFRTDFALELFTVEGQRVWGLLAKDIQGLLAPTKYASTVLRSFPSKVVEDLELIKCASEDVSFLSQTKPSSFLSMQPTTTSSSSTYSTSKQGLAAPALQHDKGNGYSALHDPAVLLLLLVFAGICLGLRCLWIRRNTRRVITNDRGA